MQPPTDHRWQPSSDIGLSTSREARCRDRLLSGPEFRRSGQGRARTFAEGARSDQAGPAPIHSLAPARSLAETWGAGSAKAGECRLPADHFGHFETRFAMCRTRSATTSHIPSPGSLTRPLPLPHFSSTKRIKELGDFISLPSLLFLSLLAADRSTLRLSLLPKPRPGWRALHPGTQSPRRAACLVEKRAGGWRREK